MSNRPLCVAFLWHMHQPDYGNVRTGEICLPWTRLHAVKDYYDMGALAVEAPGMHLTINVVPSLVDQLVSYGQGSARETHAALTIRSAGDLDEREKALLLRAFFQLTWKHMVFPYPRYKELLDLRGPKDEHGEYPRGMERYSVNDYRDLQMWYNLTWCGRELRRDRDITGFFKKGRGFTEEDKKRLLELQYSFIGRILPFYRNLVEEHGIEISVTPYYHPILPLLCDSRSAREAQPDIHLPAEPFSFSSDAIEQIRRAQKRHLETFGRSPRGMWPSEGSISDAALSLAGEAGLDWLASDEGVLAGSLQKCRRWSGFLRPEQKCSAHRWGSGAAGPDLFFRDRGLSDLIGFVYSSWDAQDAVEDFVSRLRRIRESLPDDGRHYVIPVILDGENAWEHYPENGTPFLRSLYRRLTDSDEFRPVSCSEFLDLEAHREPLESVVAGSWIYSNLSTWIGNPEKNRAWEELAATRRFLQSRRGGTESKGFDDAFREMLIAEGSDWFWWYGDDHPSENAADFDALFRNHLKSVYRLTGEEPPAGLDVPIKKVQWKARFRNPVHTITPRLDGRASDYFEWLSAGLATPAGGESMHRIDRHFDKVFFGYDSTRFYLRIDLNQFNEGDECSRERSVRVRFVAPAECYIDITHDKQNRWRLEVVRSPVDSPSVELGVEKVIELGIPLQALGVDKRAEVRFYVVLSEKEHELERFPTAEDIVVTVNPWELDQQEWIV